ncbi:hypothetical protein R83H12_02610 [Fibrobacteria bacterium R8-3-H12]
MDVLTHAFRTTCIPKANRLDAIIPSEYVGLKLEIIVLPLTQEVAMQETMDMSLAQASSLDKIWNSKQEDETWAIL